MKKLRQTLNCVSTDGRKTCHVRFQKFLLPHWFYGGAFFVGQSFSNSLSSLSSIQFMTLCKMEVPTRIPSAR